MTTIAGMWRGRSVVVGSDSLFQDNGRRAPGVPNKFVFDTRRGMALGCAGYMRINNVIAERQNYIFAGQSVGEIVSRIRKALRDDGFASKNASGPYEIDGCFLLVHSGRLWDIDNAFALAPVAEGVLWAAGTGAPYALGASTILRDMVKISAFGAVEAAINAAIAHDVFSGGPVQMCEMRRK